MRDSTLGRRRWMRCLGGGLSSLCGEGMAAAFVRKESPLSNLGLAPSPKVGEAMTFGDSPRQDRGPRALIHVSAGTNGDAASQFMHH